MKIAPIANQIYLRTIVESISGDASKTNLITKKLANDLKQSGSDANEEEVQGAMLMALAKADFNIDQIDVSDVESIKNEIQESRGYKLNEAAGTVGTIIHGIMDLLGNSALIDISIGEIEKETGKSVNKNRVKSMLKKGLVWLDKLAGAPAKGMKLLFEAIARVFGAGEFAQKIAGLAGTLIAVAIMFIIGIVTFPAITSWFWFFFSVGGLIGKGAEIVVLTKKIYKEVKNRYNVKSPDVDNTDINANPVF
jgi:hypothetical protein